MEAKKDESTKKTSEKQVIKEAIPAASKEEAKVAGKEKKLLQKKKTRSKGP